MFDDLIAIRFKNRKTGRESVFRQGTPQCAAALRSVPSKLEVIGGLDADGKHVVFESEDLPEDLQPVVEDEEPEGQDEDLPEEE